MKFAEKWFDVVNGGIDKLENFLEQCNWNMQVKKTERDIENLNRIEQGKISDEEKIDILKSQMFVAARNGDYNVGELVDAIEVLRNEIECENKKFNSPSNRASRFVLVVITTLVSSALFSVVVIDSGVCSKSDSKFCRDAQEINNVVKNYF